ncbi:MAG: hypothetical protein OEQ39_01485 [Gammaproteobacteria bacterium]|nr:hypothetical protein [Gammaproteobacteria bacterium]MDH3467753.1 hypothetical protein [Gammaproteobacteria bacterium]
MRRDYRTNMIVLLALVASAGTWAGEDREFTVIDRRAADGSVVIMPKFVLTHPGPLPFVAAAWWDLTPASDYFRVKTDQIPARWLNLTGDLPAITFKAGAVVPNSLASAFGGTAKHTFRNGEILRLIGLNTALKSVQMEFETVCRLDRRHRLSGRAIFVLSAQVGKKTFDEANRAVAAQLEPVGISEVVRECDPYSGEPPFALKPGLTVDIVEEHLGEPRRRTMDGSVEIFDYGSVRIHMQHGLIVRLGIPALD